MSLLALTSSVPDVLSLSVAAVCAVLALRLRRARDEHARRGAFLTAVLDRISDRIVVASRDGEILFINEAARADDAAAFSALGLYELDGETPVDPIDLPLQRALQGERVDGQEVVHRATSGAAERRLLVHASSIVDAGGRMLGAVATAGDVTDAREAKMRLAEANLVLRAVRDATRDLREDGDTPHAICQATHFASGASFVLLYQPDGEGNLVSTGAVGYDGDLPIVLPIDGAERYGVTHTFRSGASIFAPDALNHPHISSVWAASAGLRSAILQPVIRDGETVAVLAVGWREPIHTLSQPAAMSIGLLADEAAGALERAELIGQLRDLSRRDALTGLPNRRHWDEEIERELARATRQGYPVCVALLDLDHFKAYNDELGHHAGDYLLRTAAAAWATALREADVLARWGGEEFAICLPNCSSSEAESVLARLRGLLPDRQTCSAGMALWDGTETPSELLTRADRALYAAKDAGRDRLVCA